MLFIIPIQSYSDIITNSSSELFIAAPVDEDKHLVSSIQNILDTIYEEDRPKVQQIYLNHNNENWAKMYEIIHDQCLDSCSGDGGECTIKTVHWQDVVHYIRKCDRNKFNKKGRFLWIWIDHNRWHSIKWIKENLNVLHVENC